MTKTILMTAALLVTGCADDDRSYLKSELTCGDTWSDVGRLSACDAACVPRPDESGDGCTTNLRFTPTGSAETIDYQCTATFEIDGVRGCCESPFGADAMIKDGVPGEPSRTRRVFFLTCK